MVRAIILTASILLTLVWLAGCSTLKDNNMASARDGSRWVKVKPDKLADLPEHKMPKVNAKTYFAVGQLMQRQGNLPGALEKYQQAIQVDPSFVAAYDKIGLICTRAGRYEQAIEAFKKAIQHQPKSAYLRNNLGFTYLMAGRLDDARAEFSNAINLQPHYPRAQANLAIALARLGRYDQALEQFKRVTTEAEAHYNLAVICQRAGKTQLAHEHYKQALKLQPNFPQARQGLKSTDPLVVAARKR